MSNTDARLSSIFTYQVCACALDIGVHGMWKSQETFENLSPPSLDQQTLPFLRLKNTKSAIFIKSFVENYSRRLSFNKLKVGIQKSYKNGIPVHFVQQLFLACEFFPFVPRLSIYCLVFWKMIWLFFWKLEPWTNRLFLILNLLLQGNTFSHTGKGMNKDNKNIVVVKYGRFMRLLYLFFYSFLRLPKSVEILMHAVVGISGKGRMQLANIWKETWACGQIPWDI